MEPNVQLILNHMLGRQKAELVPEFDVKLGPRFVAVETIAGQNSADARRFLEKLADAKILERRFHEKYMACPACRSTDVPVKYNCPRCQSFEIQQKALWEHIACGVIDKEGAFKKGNEVKCPRCGREIVDTKLGIRQVGTWFECRACAKAFDLPTLEHVCRNCGRKFTVEDGILLDSYSYVIVKEAEKEFREGTLFLRPLKDALEALNFTVRIPGMLRGASGMEHVFTLTASRRHEGKDEVVVMDVVSSEGPADENPVIGLFAKKYDTNPDRSILVAIPAVGNGGKRLASLYRIDVIETVSASEATGKLKSLIHQE
jgi:transposase-like protein